MSTSASRHRSRIGRWRLLDAVVPLVSLWLLAISTLARQTLAQSSSTTTSSVLGLDQVVEGCVNDTAVVTSFYAGGGVALGVGLLMGFAIYFSRDTGSTVPFCVGLAVLTIITGVVLLIVGGTTVICVYANSGTVTTAAPTVTGEANVDIGSIANGADLVAAAACGGCGSCCLLVGR